jgi:hypothetical protein
MYDGQHPRPAGYYDNSSNRMAEHHVWCYAACMSISSFRLKEKKKSWKGFKKIRFVGQETPDDCAIATAAMIAGVSYREAWDRLAPPPTSDLAGYQDRETRLLNERGWWPSAQLVLKTVVSLELMDSIIESEEKFNSAVEDSQRLLIVLAFADGAKPDHVVVWDRDHKNVVFDPSRGEIPLSQLFNDAGLQTYSGALGFTAYRYQRGGQTIQTLVKIE